MDDNERTDHRPDEAIEQGLREIGEEERRDLLEIAQMRPSEFEEEALAGFQLSIDAKRKRPERSPFRPVPWAAAAALLLYVGIQAMQGSGGPPMNPTLGVDGATRVEVLVTEDGMLLFDLQRQPPSDGYFEIRLSGPQGERLGGTEELFGSRWSYNPVDNGPLPERYLIEVHAWHDTTDGPEEIGEPYSRWVLPQP